MATESKHWVAEEFSEMDLGDARLNKRARVMVEAFAAKPTASIPMACDGWTDMAAAYRFLDNDEVTWQGIMAPHWERTEQRMAGHRVVLCLQDTTELDFNGQKVRGLGPLNYEARRGMYVHPTYAVTPQREPLGVCDAWMWAREARDAAGVRSGQSESARWIEGYQRVAEMASRVPLSRLVYVADREGDMLGLMQCAKELGTPADWLVRAKHNRCLPDGERLWERTCAGTPLGQIVFTMGARHGVKERKVRQELWATSVELHAGKPGAVTVTCVIAREIDAPQGCKPVEWRLLTNRAAPTLEDVIELIDWYRARWEIEMFFNVLKNGCRVESMQLGSIDGIERALALYMVISWRIAHLMRLGRTCPDLDANLFFSPDEIHGAYLLTNTKPAPDRTPTLNEVLRLVARLGGFIGRKSDGEPGVKTIWLGLQEVRISAATLAALRDQ
ncbi:IS4 family transposase [Rugamonas sp. DEMB1]|uniref:IS4 family transposase n=1 Tax=Rugamonas sp. DEMB1 TaxID=3039386 RepID=UPI00244C52B9|nr:IS4 family transposase [Rugamonas sp. DEMB1]WGG52071.1 IS4 family transposase [Rugamonas sp. DEMB1]